MNAIKFIQQHDVDVAREAIEEANAYGGLYLNGKTLELSKYAPSINAVFIPDLKRLVESVDYVAIHGYEKSKEILKNAPVGAECYSWSIGISGVRDKTVELVKLKQAIADYEAIYSNDIKIVVSFGVSLMPAERLACIDLTPRPVIDCEILDHPEDYISPNCKKFDERVK